MFHNFIKKIHYWLNKDKYYKGSFLNGNIEIEISFKKCEDEKEGDNNV